MNHGPAEADTTHVPILGNSPSTEVRIIALQCPPDTSVVLYGVLGGGHNWPGQPAANPQIFGSINRDIDASEEIWTFFQQHQRTALLEATEAATDSP
jgi:poly(3-hydroxybutyrate) depolymerase